MPIPLVSVVTSVYNGEKYLEKYFDSLINQTLFDIEIICVNNTSTDNSLDILKKFESKDSRIRVFNNSVNDIGGAINLAIRNAQADYICPIDQDDWADKRMFRRLIDHTLDKDIDIIFCDYYEYYDDNNIKLIENIPKRLASSSENIKREFLVNGGRIFSSIIKRSLFLENNLYYPENLYYPDNGIASALICLAKEIVSHNEPLFYYNKSNISLTRSSNNYRFFDRIITSNLMYENFKRLNIYEEYKEELDFSYYKLIYLNTLSGCFSRFSRYPNRFVTQAKKEFGSRNINLRENIYYRNRKRGINDLISRLVMRNTNLGFIVFIFYKMIFLIKSSLKT